jgi:nitronate monooxygenase
LFGALNAGGENWFRQEIATAKNKLGDRPFGVGFITHLMESFSNLFEIALEEKVPIIAFSFADPTPYVERTKLAGLTAICQVQTLKQAKLAIDAGADVLVAQGNEAGGHTGPANLMPLLVEVLDQFPHVPVIASGGIGNGKDLARILDAGADGAWIGTRLLATHECIEVTASFKAQLIKAEASNTFYTALFDQINHVVFGGKPWPAGIAARLIRNEMTATWDDKIPELLQDTKALEKYRREMKAQNLDYTPLYAGTSVASVTSVQYVADVLQEIARDAQALID